MFRDRFEAGEKLARELEPYRGRDPLILAIPRGGIQVGYCIARALACPLDVALSKKIGHPANPEFAVGAVSLTDRVLDSEIRVPDDYVERETERIRRLLQQRRRLYMEERAPEPLRGRTVIIVDDGIATGHTVGITVDLVRRGKPKGIAVAVPVAPPEALGRLRLQGVEVVCLEAPPLFRAIGQFYEDFRQLSDSEVIGLLREANADL